MKLKVIGRYGPYPAAGGATSAYLIISDGCRVMLDFGSGALGRMYSELDAAPDAIILSHLHYDHISDIFPLSYAPAKPAIYLPFTDCPQFGQISSGGFALNRIGHLYETDIKDLHFTFYSVRHPIECYAVKVTDGKGTLFYSGDTTYFDELASYAAGADMLLLDCAQDPDGAATPHMTTKQGELLKNAVGARTVATHVSPLFSPYAAAEACGIEVAEEGAVYGTVKKR